jgi:hypothetical protein
MTRNGRTRHGSGPHHRQRAGRGSRRRHTSLLGGSLPALHPNIHTLLPPLVFLLRSYRYQHPRHLDYPCFLSSDNVTIHELYPGVQVGLGSLFVLRLPVQVTSSPILLHTISRFAPYNFLLFFLVNSVIHAHLPRVHPP